MGQATWSIHELTQREKSLSCIAADVCTRDLSLPFEMHVQMALANDVPLSDVHETILQSAIEAGHTGTLIALQRFHEICAKMGQLFLPQRETAPCEYFNESGAQTIPEDLLTMWRPVMDAHWRRGGLSAKERVYISLVGNMLQGVLGAPFTHNLLLTRQHGATDKQVKALFLFLSEFGFSRSWAALNALAGFCYI